MPARPANTCSVTQERRSQDYLLAPSRVLNEQLRNPKLELNSVKHFFKKKRKTGGIALVSIVSSNSCTSQTVRLSSIKPWMLEPSEAAGNRNNCKTGNGIN
jgi:hypothetical protein